MQVEGCEFPDDLLYDEDALTWVRLETGGTARVGITSIHAALAGRLTQVRGRPVGAGYPRGKTIGTLEGGKYFGPIRTPVGGTLLEVNEAVVRKPKVLSESPYGEGWFARVRPEGLEEESRALRKPAESADLFARRIAELHVRCFVAFPDYEMFEIGTECAAVLTKLDELLARMAIGEVVHIVSDDWTAPVEMENWSARTAQAVIETRREGNLYHFLVRRVV